jgi:hypothetical protein
LAFSPLRVPKKPAEIGATRTELRQVPTFIVAKGWQVEKDGFSGCSAE